MKMEEEDRPFVSVVVTTKNEEKNIENYLKFNSFSPSDQKVSISDISKVKKALNWEPKVNPEEGIKRLINWVQNNRSLF